MTRKFRYLLSVTSGILLSLAWLGFPGWTLFFAFLPLLYLDQFFTENKNTYRGVSFWGHAFLTVLIWNTLTTWWIAHATLTGAIMAILTNSFLMSLFLWLGHTARRNFKTGLGYIALAVFWLSFEFFHYHWDIEWPWLTLGNGFAGNIRMIQWFEYTGAAGGSLWILMLNILLLRQLLNMIKIREKKFQDFYPLASAVILFVIPMIISLYIWNNRQETHNPRQVVVVQPNIDPYSESFDAASEYEKLRKMIRLVHEKANDQTDFIVGPETIFESSLNWDEAMMKSNPFYMELEEMTLMYPKAETVFGATTLIFYDNKNEATLTARPYRERYYDVFNSALFIRRDGEFQVYHKSILVNGVEKIPFMKYLGFLRKVFINLGGASGSLGSQEESSVFEASDGTKIAPVICYESVFGEYMTSYVKKGAGLIFIITNDGWWKNTPGYKQHMSFAKLRAIETRRSIARSANTGISCFINQRGEVISPTKWWTDDVISQTVNVNDKITFYVRYGDYISRIARFAGTLLLLLLIAEGLRKDKKNPH